MKVIAMNDSDKNLAKLAEDIAKTAYAPYSKFRVGAALITSSGNIYTGCNIENVSFPATVCAEDVAVFKAISEGETKIEISIESPSQKLKIEVILPTFLGLLKFTNCEYYIQRSYQK